MSTHAFVEALLRASAENAASDAERRHARETEAMFLRQVTWKRTVKACPHNGGWMYVGTAHMQCQSCGLVTGADRYQSVIKWFEYPPDAEEVSDALGTALADWDAPQ